MGNGKHEAFKPFSAFCAGLAAEEGIERGERRRAAHWLCPPVFSGDRSRRRAQAQGR